MYDLICFASIITFEILTLATITFRLFLMSSALHSLLKHPVLSTNQAGSFQQDEHHHCQPAAD